jgi:predicted DNA-binding transcriptional regulator AlpA
VKEGENTYSVRLGARKAGISTGLMYRLAKANRIPGVIRIGEKRIVLSKVIFDKWLQGEGIAMDKDPP